MSRNNLRNIILIRQQPSLNDLIFVSFSFISKIILEKKPIFYCFRKNHEKERRKNKEVISSNYQNHS